MPPPENPPEDAPVILKGKDAIDLWQKGVEDWNTWVAQNPDAKVDFSGADFSTYGAVFFEGFHFPNGDVSFNRATFGDGGVSFFGATFGKGDVSFFKATFGDGDVSFEGAKFGDGDVSFFLATFGNGDVSFEGAKFGDGKVSFNRATFGKGDVSFFKATFGDGDVSFGDAKFGDGAVSFFRAKFGDGQVSFKRATFGDGSVNFNWATFGDINVRFYRTIFGYGNVGFLGATFGDGEVSFFDATFGRGNVQFNLATFGGRFMLLGCKNTRDIKALSFQDCHFKSTVSIKADFSCVPDLCGTIVSAHVDLDQLRITPKTRSREDAGKYRRLKELAEQNRDHEAALRFFAAERRCGRWVKGGNPWQTLWSYLSSILDLLYDKLSNYGQSIGRPCMALLVLIGLSGYLYTTCFELFPHWGDALLLAAAESIPFLTTTAIIPVKTPDKAILDTLGWPFHLWHLAYQIVSFILLFLIGIGLRNRFRL